MVLSEFLVVYKNFAFSSMLCLENGYNTDNMNRCVDYAYAGPCATDTERD